MAGELVGAKHMVPFVSYGPRYKAQRKFTTMALGPSAIPSYHSLISKETQRFLARIIDQPKDYEQCIRLYAGTLTLSVLYGYEVKGRNDEVLALAEECMDFLTNEVMSGGGIWPVDIFPFLQYLPLWMPGSEFLKKAKKWKVLLQKSVDVPYQHAKDAVVRFLCGFTMRTHLNMNTSGIGGSLGVLLFDCAPRH